MSYLVDSDYVADFLQGKKQAVDLLSNLEPQGLAISIIAYGEIYEGVYYSSNPIESERVFLQFMVGVSPVALDEAIMRQFATIRGILRTSGNIIADFDLLIASTAIHYNLTLLTRNTRHYERVPGLMLYKVSPPHN